MTGVFDVVFGLFVLSMAGVAFFTVRGAVRRDRAERGRRADQQRQQGQPGQTS